MRIYTPVNNSRAISALKKDTLREGRLRKRYIWKIEKTFGFHGGGGARALTEDRCDYRDREIRRIMIIIIIT